LPIRRSKAHALFGLAGGESLIENKVQNKTPLTKNIMPSPKKKATAKPSAKFRDLKSRKDPKAGFGAPGKHISKIL
jgi:hypothetical protein